MVVALAHTIQHVQQAARAGGFELVAVNQIGGHVTHTNDGTLRTHGGHPRGMALDLHSFVLRDANGRESLVSLKADWLTARSSREEHHGQVVTQSAEEVANMSPNERWLRQVWGFLESEFSFVVTPSHNEHHQDHFHPEILPTRRQAARSQASFAEYLRQHPEAAPGG
jgi:hypothetical protein